MVAWFLFFKIGAFWLCCALLWPQPSIALLGNCSWFVCNVAWVKGPESLHCAHRMEMHCVVSWLEQSGAFSGQISVKCTHFGVKTGPEWTLRILAPPEHYQNCCPLGRLSLGHQETEKLGGAFFGGASGCFCVVSTAFFWVFTPNSQN